MNCKHCDAQIPEDSVFCPVCGKELNCEQTTAEVAAEETAVEAAAEETAVEAAAEETASNPETVEEPAAKAKADTKRITVAVVALVMVAAILIGLFAATAGIKPAADPTVETSAPVVITADGNPASPQCKASYTVSDEQAIASSNVVVATMGDKTLTNGVLQAFYWQEVIMFLNEYGNYAASLGLDVYSPLDTQLMYASEPAISWQQFFLDGAVETWKTYQALALEAEENGFEIPADIQAELDKMPADLEAGAQSSGFESADAMIRKYAGAACSLESYLQHIYTDYYGRSYYYDFSEKLNPTDAEVEAFYAENEDYYTDGGITKDGKYVNVRHVLLQPEGGEVSEDGYSMVYTDEAWEACRIKAEALYNKWQEGDKSEDSFAQLAMTESVDGSAANGGLYEDVYVGQMVPEFENWCFDESRVPGDHGLVKTQYGYHIMFFSAHRDWLAIARDGLINDIAYDKIPETVEKYTAEVDFSLVELGQLNFD